MIDQPVLYQLHNMVHIDYSNDPNAMGMHMQHMNIDRVHCMIGMIRDTFYTFVSLDHRIVNLNIPYKDLHPTYNGPGMMYKLMDQLLFSLTST